MYSLHPGVVRTELGRHLIKRIGIFKYLLGAFLWPFTKNPVQGAQTSIYCAVAEEISGHSGRYYSDCQEKEVAPQAKDDKMAERLWALSEKLVGL